MPEKTISLHIRVPEGIVKEIKQLAKKTNTPQGTALKYLIEQARNEQIDTRLIALEETMRKETKRVWDVVRDLTGYIIDQRAMKTVGEVREKGKISEDARKELEYDKELLEKVDRAGKSPYYETVCAMLDEG